MEFRDSERKTVGPVAWRDQARSQNRHPSASLTDAPSASEVGALKIYRWPTLLKEPAKDCGTLIFFVSCPLLMIAREGTVPEGGSSPLTATVGGLRVTDLGREFNRSFPRDHTGGCPDKL